MANNVAEDLVSFKKGPTQGIFSFDCMRQGSKAEVLRGVGKRGEQDMPQAAINIHRDL
jgi:hypothetical protein